MGNRQVMHECRRLAAGTLVCAVLAAALLFPGGGCAVIRRAEDMQPLNVVDFGADPSGKTDATDILVRLHETGAEIYYPNGTYRFNGPRLRLDGGVRFESCKGVVVRNDISPAPIVQFDDQGNLIGLQQNHLEQDQSDLGGNLPVPSGSLVPPPLSEGAGPPAADLLAHWYNDFGLEHRRLEKRRTGWIGWYYWTWNFHDAGGDGYDPARHPLLGFYRGDDPTVLDWQCYWLNEYGVRGVILCWSNRDPERALEHWEQPGSPRHWLYQLFNHVPNFRRLRYVMWGISPWLPSTKENRERVERGWKRLIEDVYLQYPNFYAISANGRRFPVVYVWEEGALRGVFDNYRGSAAIQAFYTRLAERFQAAGFGGIALFTRHAISDRLMDRPALERAGVLRYAAFYATSHSGDSSTYARLVDTYAPPVGPRTIPNVVTAKHSHTPHPSKWVCPGHSPALFQDLLTKAVAHIDKQGMPRILTCYNVAEWAEGGPGLQPNMQDRFGYLEAVRNVLVRRPAALPSKRPVRSAGGAHVE